MKILIVEDDPIQCLEREYQVRSLGYQFTSCLDATSALEAWQTEFYTLIVQNLGLPDMHGTEICRRIRNSPQGAQSKIVVISGSNTPEEIQAAFEVGADKFLSKPVHPDLFKQHVEELIQLETCVQQND